MTDFLAQMEAASRRRVERAKTEQPLSSIRDSTASSTLHLDAFCMIAELKRVSPAEGTLDLEAAAATVGARYVKAGASAVSVLTEPERFGGSLADIRAVSQAVPAPVMRKDFLVDPYQVYEAASRGASGVLLIEGIARDNHQAIIDAAAAAQCFVLIEAFTVDEFHRCVALARYAEQQGVQPLLGVNCRDLTTLRVEPERFRQFSDLLPDDLVTVAESGLSTPDDVRSVTTLGFRGALVGTALMRNANPERLLADMIEAASAVTNP